MNILFNLLSSIFFSQVLKVKNSFIGFEQILLSQKNSYTLKGSLIKMKI